MAGGKGKKRENDVQEVFVLYEKALVCLFEDDPKAAKKLFRELEEKFPNDMEVIARARTFGHICDRRLNSGSVAAPKTAEAAYDAAIYHHNNGDFENALKGYETALKLATGEEASHVYYARAATRARQGKGEEALADLKKAIELDRDCRYLALRDPDFAPILDTDDFRRLLGG